MYGMEPAAWLESRLQGIQLIDLNAPTQDVLDARTQRAFARQPLAERDPLLALVWGRLDGKSLSSAYNADTLKEITRARGRGLFKSREKGGIPIDELADEAVRRGLLPEGSGADELVERLKRGKKPEKGFYQAGNELASRFADMPMIEADSSQWFGPGREIPVSEEVETPEQRKMLRNAVKTWAKERFSGGMPVVNADTGWQIQVTPKGIENSLSHGFDKTLARSIPFIPQIIEGGIHVDSIRKTPQLLSHIFANKIRLDGQDYVVGFVLREDVNGNRFYDHELTEIISPDRLVPGHPSDEGPSGEGSSGHRDQSGAFPPIRSMRPASQKMARNTQPEQTGVM